MNFFKDKHISEAQTLAFIVLNTLMGVFIFFTVFTIDTEKEAFWANYTNKVDICNTSILKKSKWFESYGAYELLEEINEDLQQLESYLFFAKRGGVLKVDNETIEVHQVLDVSIYRQIQVVHQLFKENEVGIRRSIAALRSNPTNQIKDTYLSQIHKFSKSIQLENETLQKIISKHYEQVKLQRNLFIIGCLVIFITLNALLILRVHQDIFKSLREMNIGLHRYFRNDNKIKDIRLSDTIGDLKSTVNAFVQNVENASSFAKKIGEGKLNATTGGLNTTTILGKSLLEMQNKLQEVAEEEKKRSWIAEGISKIGDMLSGHQYEQFDNMVFSFIKLITDYMACNQGAIFLKEDTNEGTFLKLQSAYAYEKKKYLEKEQKVDEGLIGQCFQEKEVIYIEDVPNDYIQITSGLGYANPRILLLLPIVLDDECYGVVELAAFEKLPAYYHNFGKLACDKLATAISTFRMNEHTSKLLLESRKMNEELTQKEEQMQSYAAEISREYATLGAELNANKVTEQEVARLNELEEKLTRTEAELTKYKDLLRINKDELVLQDKKLEAKSSRIKSLQAKLEARKESNIDEQKDDVVIENNLKVENALLRQQIEKLKGERIINQTTINQAIPTAELNLKGEIIAANELFLKLFGFEQKEILNRHESIILAPSPKANSDNEKIWKAIMSGVSYESELNFITKDKDILLRRVSYTPVKSPSGRLFKIILMVQNIAV